MRIRAASIAPLLLVALVSHQIAAEPGVIRDPFHESYDAWMNGEVDSDLLIQEMRRLDGILGELGPSWENLYWRARTAYVRAQVYYERGEEELSMRELEECREFAETSNEFHQNSDSWRVMAEATSLMMAQRGFAYTILNFSRSQSEARRAIELDPWNARASHIIAQFLCNAPRIAGGNVEEGIQMLRDVAERRDLVGEDRFVILLTLSEVLRNAGQTAQAAMAGREAMAIFPGNERGREIVQAIESTLP